MTFLFAGNGNAQVKDIEEVMIQVSLNNTPIEKAFSTIEKLSGYSFVYTHKEVKNLPKVSTNNDSKSVYDLLKAIAQQTGLQFRQVNQNIHVRKIEDLGLKEEPVLIKNEMADVTVTGIVTDANGEPIPGVTVSVPDTGIGTATDLNGNYSLSVPEGSTMVFSFIGFETQRVPVGDQSIINVTLIEDLTSLNEVVVVGYGVQKRSDITGSVASLSKERLEMVPNVNIAQAIQGSIPGVMVQNTSAGAEPSLDIMVRGRNSIGANNSPLVVVDGIPYGGQLSDINPNDVESVEILKDASAAAIYGSRGRMG
jgi:TonB-dependent SusC/RagA subfamily outer membrane receptor